ncbi:SdpI family protein [Saccharomonospora xinjiangensis]|uniref:SdpI family protein n=1 Tax=Saccharomonospora xinjiangensis TaxID=75294 RepID=UPI0005930E91|nr:SdpI family protein [Saccharomonospora xinjiangensis]
MFVLALIPALLGVLVGWGGFLGWQEKLPRSRGAGVRTEATMRSDEAFRVANRVAGLPTMVAGAVGVLAGAATLAMPSTLGAVLAATFGVVAVFVLVAGGGVLGHRAATLIPAPVEPAGCGGCACGGGGCGALR